MKEILSIEQFRSRYAVAGKRAKPKRNVSPKDRQPYVGIRFLRANCIRMRGPHTFVMCDQESHG